MPDVTDTEKIKKVRHRRVHMANERTFLAWIRTSIAIMAFGFVVEKFALFLRQLSYVFGKSGLPEIQLPPSRGYSTIFGIILVGVGAMMGLLSFIRFKKVEKQIDDDTYFPSPILDMLLTLSILAIGVFLTYYLIHSI